jgi:hypothetical protein
MNNKTVKPKRFDLMERLIHFSVRIIQVCQALPNSKVGNHILEDCRIEFNKTQEQTSSTYPRM